MQRWYRKLFAQDGVITIEFSFIYIIFVAFVFIIFEINKFIFIITAMDYSLSEAARNSAYKDNSTSVVDYQRVFDEYFFSQSGFWVMFINPKDIKVEASFCSTVNEVIKGRCSSLYNSQKKLALYSVSYGYRPLKIISQVAWAESLFSQLDGLFTRKVTYMIESSR
ncbi:hypothetical protein WB67_06835 [bacteria symbiont BFo2 of Frankliniella occidentalis]|nr:hypothetical protein WB67_06835 [bacteria symbiont BFo2 of Frankliniella occidentalis]